MPGLGGEYLDFRICLPCHLLRDVGVSRVTGGTGTLLAAGSREFGPGFEPDAEVIGQEGVLVPSVGKGVEDWADHGRFRRRDR